MDDPLDMETARKSHARYLLGRELELKEKVAWAAAYHSADCECWCCGLSPAPMAGDEPLEPFLIPVTIRGGSAM